jgi:hypothetical protein
MQVLHAGGWRRRRTRCRRRSARGRGCCWIARTGRRPCGACFASSTRATIRPNTAIWAGWGEPWGARGGWPSCSGSIRRDRRRVMCWPTSWPLCSARGSGWQAAQRRSRARWSRPPPGKWVPPPRRWGRRPEKHTRRPEERIHRLEERVRLVRRRRVPWPVERTRGPEERIQRPGEQIRLARRRRALPRRRRSRQASGWVPRRGQRGRRPGRGSERLGVPSRWPLTGSGSG